MHPVEFEVVALTPELRRKMEESPKDAGVTLETEARAVKPNKMDRSLKFRLTNNSKNAISFRQYIGQDLAPMETEYFGGDGRWHNQSLGWCGTFLGSEKLEPKQVVTISTYAPSESSVRFVRFTLTILENEKFRKVVSPVVELKD